MKRHWSDRDKATLNLPEPSSASRLVLPLGDRARADKVSRRMRLLNLRWMIDRLKNRSPEDAININRFQRRSYIASRAQLFMKASLRTV